MRYDALTHLGMHGDILRERSLYPIDRQGGQVERCRI